MSNRPFVKQLIFTEPVLAGMENTAHLIGEWPTPSWKFKSTSTTVEESTRRLIVDVEGEKRPGMALMVIQPFEQDIPVLVPSPGEWTVVVKGRAGDLSVKITAT